MKGPFKVKSVSGLLIEAEIEGAAIGDIYQILALDKQTKLCEVVAFEGVKVWLLSLTRNLNGISSGSEIYFKEHSLTISLSPQLLGRILNALGEPLDTKGNLVYGESRSIQVSNLKYCSDNRLKKALYTGIRAIDSLLTIAFGTLVGLFTSAGVAKLSTLSIIAKQNTADINVICLISYTRKQVMDFIQGAVGEKTLADSVYVVSLVEESPLMHLKALLTAITIAEYFRDQGKNVLLMIDSLSEIISEIENLNSLTGLKTVYNHQAVAFCSEILERLSLHVEKGSITSFATISLDENIDNFIINSIRDSLDAHIWFSLEMAMQNHFPAIDTSVSSSKFFTEVTDLEHQKMASCLRNLILASKASIKESSSSVPDYNNGNSEKIINDFLKQDTQELLPFSKTLEDLRRVVRLLEKF